MAQIFYQVGMSRNPQGGEEVDLEKLNFTLRQNFDSINTHDDHVNATSGVHGIVGSLVGGNMAGKHPTEWPSLSDCKDKQLLLWNNEAAGWRLYIRSGANLLYIDLTEV